MQKMLPQLLRHDFWERKGNIPALTVLIQAYLHTAPSLIARSYLEPVLGIFSKLLAVSRHYAEAHALIASVLAHIPPPELERYIPEIFRQLFRALTGPQKSTRNTVAFVVMVSKFACWHGPAAMVAAVDTAQRGASTAILTQVVPNNLSHVHGKEERRVVGIALARFLCEHEALLAVRSPVFSQLWPRFAQPRRSGGGEGCRAERRLDSDSHAGDAQQPVPLP
jgi:hypothetical protein